MLNIKWTKAICSASLACPLEANAARRLVVVVPKRKVILLGIIELQLTNIATKSESIDSVKLYQPSPSQRSEGRGED